MKNPSGAADPTGFELERCNVKGSLHRCKPLSDCRVCGNLSDPGPRPPHNLDAERAVLGSIILESQLIPEVATAAGSRAAGNPTRRRGRNLTEAQRAMLRGRLYNEAKGTHGGTTPPKVREQVVKVTTWYLTPDNRRADWESKWSVRSDGQA